MRNEHFHFWHEHFSLKERRLISYVQTPENAPEVSDATRKKAKVFLKKMRIDLSAELDPAKRLKLLDERFASVTSPELAIALVEESEADPILHAKAVERDGVIKASIAERKRLSKDAEATKRAKAGEEKGVMAKTGEWFSDRGKDVGKWWEKTGANPNNWSPEARTKATAVAVAAGVTVVAYYVLKGLKSFFFGVKKIKEKAVEGSKSLFKTVLLFVGLAAAGLLGYAGYKGINEAIIGKFTGELENLKTKAAEQKSALETVAGAEADTMRAKYERTIARIAELEEKVGEKPTEEDSPAEKPPKDTDEPEEPDDKEKARKALEENFALIAMLKLVDTSSWNLEDRAKRAQLADVISANATFSMMEIFSNPLDIGGENDTKNRKKAAETLLKFCRKYKDQLILNIATYERISLSKAEEKVLAMPLPEYIEVVMQNFSVVVSVMDHMQKYRNNLFAALGSLDVKEMVRKDVGVRTELYSIARDIAGVDDETIAKLDAVEMLRLVAGTRTFGGTIDHAAGVVLGSDASNEEKILSKVFKEIRDGDTYKYLIPAFHDVFPTAEAGNVDVLVHRYLTTRMPLDQALRMFVYRRWMDKGNPSGLVMMQMEILKFVADTDTGLLGLGFKIKKYQIINNIIEKLLGKSGEELSREWEKVGIKNLPVKTFAGAAGIFKFMLENATPSIWGWFKEQASLGIAIGVEHTVAVGVGFVSTAEAYRLYTNYITNPDKVKDGLMSWAGGFSGREKDPLVKAGNAVRKVIPGMPTHTHISGAAQKYKEVYDAIITLDRADSASKARFDDLYGMLRKATNSTHDPTGWRVLANALHKEGFTVAAESAELFIKNPGMRNALYHLRFNSQSWGIIPFPGWRKVAVSSFRLYYRGRDATIGRLLAIPGMFDKYGTAIAIVDDTARLEAFARLLKRGGNIDDLLAVGAKASDIIQVVDSVDDIERCIVLMTKNKMIKHQGKLLELLRSGRTPAQLADAGVDVAQLLDAIDDINKTAGKVEVAADFITDARKVLNSADNVRAAVEAITFINDEAVRVAHIKTLLSHLDDEAALLRAGISSADLLKAGLKVDRVIDMCLTLDDVGMRQAAMLDLLHAGYVDDLVKEALKGGPKYVNNLKAIVAGVSGLPADVITKITTMKVWGRSAAEAVPLLDAFAAIPKDWRSSPDFVRARGQYAGEARDAFDEAAKRLSKMDDIPLERALGLLGDKSVIDVLGNVKVFGGTHIDEAVRVALVGTDLKKTAKAVQRTLSYVSALGTNATEAMMDQKVLSFITKWDGADPAFIAKFVAKLKETSRLGKNSAAGAKALAALTDSGEMLEMMSVARKLSIVRGFSVLMAFEVAALGFDVYSYYEAKSRVEKSQKRVDEVLGSNGFTKSGADGIVVYTHKKTGITINGTFIFQSMEAEVGHRMSNVVASSIGTAAAGVAFLTPCIAFGPAGIAIAVATLTVHGFVEAMAQDDKRRLISEMDMGVLALIGFGSAIGEGEYDALADASNPMLSDWFHSEKYNTLDKSEYRKRAIMSMFAQELGGLSRDYPALHLEIMGEKDMFELMREGGDLYSEDFKTVIKPYLTMRMFQLATKGDSADDATWKDFSDFKIDMGFWDFTNIEIEDIRIAIRESAILYVQHIRERKYRIARAALAKQKNGETTEIIDSTDRIHRLASEKTAYALQEAAVTALGAKMSFGVPVSSLSYKDIDDKTQVEIILASARKKLDDQMMKSVSIPAYSGKYVMRPARTDYIPRTRDEFSRNDFMVTIPDKLVPKHEGSRTVLLWTLPYIALSNDAEKDPVLRRKTFTKRLARIRGKMDVWRNNRSKNGLHAFDKFGLGLVQQDKEDLRDLMMLLYQYPEYDPNGSLRLMVQHTEGWEVGDINANIGGSGRPLDSEHIGMQFPSHFEKYARWNKAPIWLMPYLIVPESKETDKTERYKAFMSRSRSIDRGLTAFEQDKWFGGGEQKSFFEYYALFSEYPEFDKGGAMRKRIRSMSQYNWQASWARYSDGHPRATEANATFNVLKTHQKYWEARKYAYVPWDPSKARVTYVPIDTSPNTDQLALAGLRDRVGDDNVDDIPSFEKMMSGVDKGRYDGIRRTIYVHTEGLEEPIKIEARIPKSDNETVVTDHHIEGIGTFFCRTENRRSASRKVTTTYHWYYKAEANPVQFHVNNRNTRGDALPGLRFDVLKPRNEREVNLHEHIHACVIPYTDSYVSVTIRLKDRREKTYEYINSITMGKMIKDFGAYVTIQKIRQRSSSVYDLVLIPKNREAIESITVNRDPKSYGTEHHYTLTKEVYTFNDSTEVEPLSAAVQKLHAEAIQFLGLEEQQKGIYTRKGYEGLYILQPDGTVFWTGGIIERTKKRGHARTYMDGIWTIDVTKPLDPAIERLTIWATSEFKVPRRRYRLTVNGEYFKRAPVDVVLEPGKPFPPTILEHWTIRSEKNHWVIKPKGMIYGLYIFRDLETGSVFEIKSSTISKDAFQTRLKNRAKYYTDRGETPPTTAPKWTGVYKYTPPASPGLQGKMDPEFIRQWRANLIAQVRKVVPTLTLKNSGAYYDSETRCHYSFSKIGEFRRSWGMHNKTFAYISPAIFKNGNWEEQEDSSRERHIGYCAEDKQIAQEKAAKRLARETTETEEEEIPNIP